MPGSGYGLEMHGPEGLPRFFVTDPPAEGELALGPEESTHAARVLRLGPGDAFEALDGEGARWNCELLEVGRRRAVARVLSGPVVEPAPGEPGSDLPWIEAAIAWPKKGRAEDMLGPLTQLGVASIRPLEATFSNARKLDAEPPERWHKLVREAVKQCGRAHLPRFVPPTSIVGLAGELEGAATAVLDQAGSLSLDVWLRSLPPAGEGRIGTRLRPLRLIVGPEGGFADAEREALLQAGATFTRLGPHVLRVEVAALAALAITTTTLHRQSP